MSRIHIPLRAVSASNRKTPGVFHVSVDETRSVSHFSKLLETGIMQAPGGGGREEWYFRDVKINRC